MSQGLREIIRELSCYIDLPMKEIKLMEEKAITAILGMVPEKMVGDELGEIAYNQAITTILKNFEGGA